MSGPADYRWAVRFPTNLMRSRTRALAVTAARLLNKQVGAVIEEAIVELLNARLGIPLAGMVIERVATEARE